MHSRGPYNGLTFPFLVTVFVILFVFYTSNSPQSVANDTPSFIPKLQPKFANIEGSKFEESDSENDWQQGLKGLHYKFVSKGAAETGVGPPGSFGLITHKKGTNMMLITYHPHNTIEYDAKHFYNDRILLTVNQNPDENIPAMGNERRGEWIYHLPGDHSQEEKIHYTSTEFDLEETPGGPILRVHHMSAKSHQQSTICTAFGEGLLHASVGNIATFTIKVNNISALNYPWDILFSALAVGDNHIFVADPLPYSRGSDEITFSYTPTMKGEYDFYVEQLFRGKPEQFQVPGSPFRLVIQGTEVNEAVQKTLTDSLPSCQAIPQYNMSWVEGSWRTRKLVGHKYGVLRSGWVFQPKICSFDIFDQKDLAIAAASSVPRTIVILGSSVDRGIFLSLVDLILNDREKAHFDTSDLNQCWGYAEIQVGSLRIIYQDFRIEHTSKKHFQNDNNFTVTCHNEKKVSEGYTFFDDALGFIQEFLFNDRIWPDVIFVCVRELMHIKSLFSKIPPTWEGVMYPTNSFKLKWGSFYTASGIEDYKKLALKYPSIDKRIQIVDGFAISRGMRHGSQSSPLIMGSNHFHRLCHELGGKMKICGDATEMVAQLLLGKAIAPKGKDVWQKSIRSEDSKVAESMDTREIMVCHDCPKSLLPFHIKRIPDLKCYRSTQGLRPAEEKNFKVWDGTLCPSECMKTNPTGQAQTESGPVDVRECVVSVK